MLREKFRHTWSWDRGGGLPLWLLSFVFHFSVLTTLGLAVQVTPARIADEPVREGGIVLVARTADKPDYFADESREEHAGAATEIAKRGEIMPLPTELQQPLPDGPQLPANVQQLAAAAAGSLPSAGNVAQHDGRGGPMRGRNEPVETQVFGVRGKGSRFIYVFDRSSSMEGPPLVAAKRELIASLQSLQSVHQFQIIFYHQEPQLMPAFRGQSRQMVFADEPGKRQAANFIGGIFAYGATDHIHALATALQMRPDVIFFLTDADEPQLRTEDFDKIRRLNQGTIINAVEFGNGAPKTRFSFLQQLAAENGGHHTYVDVTRLPR